MSPIEKLKAHRAEQARAAQQLALREAEANHGRYWRLAEQIAAGGQPAVDEIDSTLRGVDQTPDQLDVDAQLLRDLREAEPLAAKAEQILPQLLEEVAAARSAYTETLERLRDQGVREPIRVDPLGYAPPTVVGPLRAPRARLVAAEKAVAEASSHVTAVEELRWKLEKRKRETASPAVPA